MMTTTIPAKQVKFGHRVLRHYRDRDSIWIVCRVGGFRHDGQELVELYVLTQERGDVTYLLEANEPVEVIV